MSGTIFISYSRQDGRFALKLGQDLRNNGVDLWIDQLDIPLGGRWDREVEEALKRCARLIVILSPDAVASENVMDEVSYALGERKQVIPVVCRSCELPLRLQRLQYIDLSADYRQGVERLVAILKSESAAPAGPSPVHEEMGRRRYARLWVTAVILLLGLAGSIGVLGSLRTVDDRRGVPLPAQTSPAQPEPRPPSSAPQIEARAPLVPPPSDAPFFMTRSVTEADLVGKSTWELDVMRNEIYARHGRRFGRQDLQAYFDKQSWYQAKYPPESFPASLLTETQSQNANLIKLYQDRIKKY